MSQQVEPVRDREPSGEVVERLPSGARPGPEVQEGRYVRVEPLDPEAHAGELFAAGHADERARRVWDYMSYGPWETEEAFRGWLGEQATWEDPLYFALRDLGSRRAGGVASYLNIVPAHGTIEIGHIWFGPALQNTAAATEALFLMIRHAMDDLGYRRMEWKCNALNAASRGAAVRLGFAFEGIFYKHFVSKGRNRDTAWFSIVDDEWPRVRANFEAWLAPENFDGEGRQRTSLRELNRRVR